MELSQPIAVFDSGVGGLTVMREIALMLPEEDVVYFGDTARVPYGVKSPRTIIQFAREDCQFLVRFQPKVIVVACNTASSVAVEVLRKELDVPVCDVISPGARAAVASGAKRIGVIGTEATVSSGTYEKQIISLAPDRLVYAKACPLFVPLVEEGRDSSDNIVKAAAREYLSYFRDKGIGAMVLGCTHYPLIQEAIQGELSPWVQLIDSAQEAAREVVERLSCQDLRRKENPSRSLNFYASDSPDRFARVGARFMRMEISKVQLVSPEDFFVRRTPGAEI